MSILRMYRPPILALAAFIILFFVTACAEGQDRELVTAYPLEAFYLDKSFRQHRLSYEIKKDKRHFKIPAEVEHFGYRIELSPRLKINSELLNEIKTSGSTAVEVNVCDLLLAEKKLDKLLSDTTSFLSSASKLQYWKLNGCFKTTVKLCCPNPQGSISSRSLH